MLSKGNHLEKDVIQHFLHKCNGGTRAESTRKTLKIAFDLPNDTNNVSMNIFKSSKIFLVLQIRRLFSNFCF